MQVCEHQRSEDGEFCRHCGANYVGGTFGTEATCKVRTVNSESYEVRPEPVKRQYAINDMDIISKRIAELKAQRDQILAEPEPESGPAQPVEHDYYDGCG